MSALSKSTCQATRRQRAQRRCRHRRAPAHKTQAPSRISGGAPAPLPAHVPGLSLSLRIADCPFPLSNHAQGCQLAARTAVHVGHQASVRDAVNPIPTAVRTSASVHAALHPARRRGISTTRMRPPGTPLRPRRERASTSRSRRSAIPRPHRFWSPIFASPGMGRFGIAAGSGFLMCAVAGG